MKRIAIYISGILILASCGQPDKQPVKMNPISKPTAKTDIKVASESTDDTIPKVIIPEGTVQVSYKDADITSKIDILHIADYNKQDIDPKVAGLNWTGLFYNNKQDFYIGPAKLKFTPQHSEFDEKQNEKTGWHITSNVKDENIILMKGAYNVVKGPVKKALLSTMLIHAGQKLEFAYYGVTYTLYTTGYKKQGGVYNFKLFLLAKVKGRYFNQLLYALDPGIALNGGGDMSESVEIEFAGDLDGDKIPDFIIDGSGYSKPAGDKAILKLVSFFGTSD